MNAIEMRESLIHSAIDSKAMIEDLQTEIIKLRSQLRVARGLQIKCDKCGEQITEPGALVFTPTDNPALFKKEHLCLKCSKLITATGGEGK